MNFKNSESAFFNSDISYPNGDTEDVVHYTLTGYDSVTTVGYSTITVNCAGPDADKVKIKFLNTGNTVSCPATHDYFNNEYSKTGGVTIWFDSGSGLYATWSVSITTSK